MDIKLILKPGMVWLPTLSLGMSDIQTQIRVLEAAMSSALLTVVLAKSYGCDAGLAAKLVFATSVASCVTVAAMFHLLA